MTPVDGRIDYSYYVFSREWPASVCAQQKCSAEFLENYKGDDFNMHGIWPSGLGASACKYPANCISENYDESLLDSGIKFFCK